MEEAHAGPLVAEGERERVRRVAETLAECSHPRLPWLLAYYCTAAAMDADGRRFAFFTHAGEHVTAWSPVHMMGVHMLTDSDRTRDGARFVADDDDPDFDEDADTEGGGAIARFLRGFVSNPDAYRARAPEAQQTLETVEFLQAWQTAVGTALPALGGAWLAWYEAGKSQRVVAGGAGVPLSQVRLPALGDEEPAYVPLMLLMRYVMANAGSDGCMDVNGMLMELSEAYDFAPDQPVRVWLEGLMQRYCAAAAASSPPPAEEDEDEDAEADAAADLREGDALSKAAAAAAASDDDSEAQPMDEGGDDDDA